jgi:hypothetical protein
MRLLKRDQKSVAFKESSPQQEADGTTFIGYSETCVRLKGNVQPAGGKAMAEQYGDRLAYMLVMYIERSPTSESLLKSFNSESKSYGACVYSCNVDYKVVAIRGWRHIVIELERVRS